jgi:hypothetical protein
LAKHTSHQIGVRKTEISLVCQFAKGWGGIRRCGRHSKERLWGKLRKCFWVNVTLSF